MNGTEYLERLINLSPALFESLILRVKVHPAYLPSVQAPQVTRAVDLLRHLEMQGAVGWNLLDEALAWTAQQPTTAASSHPIDMELDDIKQILEEGDYELAQRYLGRIEQHRWIDLSPSRQVRLLAQKAYIYFAKGEPTTAAYEYLKAAKIGPSDEKTRINEAIAYEFLNQSSRAHELAEALIRDFPASNRAFAVWLRTAPRECAAEAQEQQVELRQPHSDAEVYLAVVTRAINQRDFARAERLARRATEIDKEWPATWLSLGLAIAQSVVPEGTQRPVALSEEQRERLHQSVRTLEQAAQRARLDKHLMVKVEALVCCAQVHDLLKEHAAAERLLREANSTKSSDALILLYLGNCLREQKHYEEAVQHLERALQFRASPQTRFGLALALSGRKREGDRDRATELFTEVAQHSGGNLRAQSLKFAIQGQLAQQKRDEATHLLSQISPDAVSPVLHRALQGLVFLERGNEADASSEASAALQSWTAANSEIETETLASLLTRLERYTDALPLWQAIFDPNSPGPEASNLVFCAQQLHRDDIVLSVCQQLREMKTASPNFEKIEISLLEQYDPGQAIGIIQEYVDRHPEDNIFHLALISCQIRIGIIDSCKFPLDKLPSAKDIDPEYGERITQLLCDNGKELDARNYAYELVRNHYSSMSAHRAYSLTFLSNLPDASVENSFSSIQPGVAVAYNMEMEGEDNAQWFIIEDSFNPRLELREYSPTDPWSQAFLGKKVGDSLRIPSASGHGPLAIVKHIQSKFSYRLQDSMQQMTKSFTAASGWIAIHTPDIDKAEVNPEMALKPLFDHFAVYTQQYQLSIEKYRHYPLSICLFGNLSGRSTFESCFTLMAHEDIGIKCWGGSPTEQEASEWLLSTPLQIVIDLTAIATLFALNRLDLLGATGVHFIVSQATIEELRNEIRKSRPHPRVVGSLEAHEDARRHNSLSNLLTTIMKHCEIHGGLQLAAMDPEKRKILLEFFGRHGAESIVLARSTNAILWTDDAIVAAFAKHNLDVRRVWSQIALQILSRDLPAELFVDCTAKLVGWGYDRTNLDFSVLMRAGEMSGWQASAFPLKQIINIFSNGSTNLLVCVQALSSLIVKIEQQDIVNSSAQSVYKIIRKVLCLRPGGTQAVQTMLAELPPLIRQRLRHAKI